MKKTVFTIISCITLFSLTVSAQSAWTKKADFGSTARANAAGFSIGTILYAGTGNTGTQASTATEDFWMYDPSLDSWTQKANFGGGKRANATGFSIGNKGYICMGKDNNGVFKTDIYEYDSTGNSWTAKTSFTGTARGFATSFVIGDNAFVGTGYNGSTYLKDFWKYNSVADSWTQVADLSGNARSYSVGMTLSGKGYVGCGRDAAAAYKDFYQYDTTSNTWSAKADFGAGVMYGSAFFVVANKGYVVLGNKGTSGPSDECWEYDPSGNTWNKKSNFTGNAQGGALGLTDGTYGYVVFGGGLSGLVKELYQFDPTSTASVSKLDEEKIQLYPNPSKGIIRINLPMNVEHVNVYDVSGALVESYNNENVNGKAMLIDLSTKAKGVYFLNISLEGQSVVKKVMVY